MESEPQGKLTRATITRESALMRCKICQHEERPRIDGLLVGDASCRDIAGRFRLSKTGVSRHKRNHVPESLELAKQNQDALNADSLLAEMADLKRRLRRVLDQAKEAGNPVAFCGLGA